MLTVIEKWIRVNTHYTRSVNLERDANSTDVLKAYIPTTRALLTLEKIAQTLNSQEIPRAWSLVGAYGSGKSSFANFLNHLFADKEHRAIACELLEKTNPETWQKMKPLLSEKSYLIISVTGSPESITQALIRSMCKAAKTFLGSKNPIVSELQHAKKTKSTTNQVIELIKKLQQAVIEKRGAGILLVIDELGKFLEYEARHSSNEIFLLQSLAEHANKGSQANLLIVVLMHQAFDQYAKGFGENLRNEWQKIQGRFESISFLESAEQTLRVVSNAFQQNLTASQFDPIKTKAAFFADVLANENALPRGLEKDVARDLFAKCYPLHPLSLLILPTLCQKVAQNERTLFSYLGSAEQHGFKDSLQNLKLGDWILPSEIFDYFIQNQSAATVDHATHRRWAEVISALERLGDAPVQCEQLLKSIGLFNIIGTQSGFKASKALVNLCLANETLVDETLDDLTQKSLLHYRKYNSEYRIWQGSDFDLDTELNETVQQLGRCSIAKILNDNKLLPPIVARKYSIDWATLRYFQPIYIDSDTFEKPFSSNTTPSILIFIAQNVDDIAKFNLWREQKTADAFNIYVLVDDNAKILTTAALDVLALQKIQRENQAVNGDPVAQRELKDRLSHVQRQQERALHDLLEHPENQAWFFKNEPIEITHRRDLQTALSNILTQIYPHTPIIRNELINRDKLSSQAAGARSKLAARLMTHSQYEDLAFEKDKFPPEKAIYRAMFKATGLHRLNENGQWFLVNPTSDNQNNIAAVWQAISEFIKKQKCSVSEIYEHLMQPPYGIKAGVLPLLFIGYYLVNQKQLVIYEENVFCPVITIEHFEILIKRPELFSVEAFEMSGVQVELFNQYLDTLIGKVSDESTLLDIMKPLAKFVKTLPFYTTHTKKVEPQTLAVLAAFQKAQNPIRLLFELLPQACGFSAFTQETFETVPPQEFLNELVKHLKILKQTYPDLLNRFQQSLCRAFELHEATDLKMLRAQLVQRFSGLENYSKHESDLRSFIKRFQDNVLEDEKWLESLATLLGKASPDKWKEDNEGIAQYQLEQLSSRLLQLASLYKTDNPNAVSLLLVSQQGEKICLIDANEMVTKQAVEQLNKIKQTIDTDDRDVKLAAIALWLQELQPKI